MSYPAYTRVEELTPRDIEEGKRAAMTGRVGYIHDPFDFAQVFTGPPAARMLIRAKQPRGNCIASLDALEQPLAPKDPAFKAITPRASYAPCVDNFILARGAMVLVAAHLANREYTFGRDDTATFCARPLLFVAPLAERDFERETIAQFMCTAETPADAPREYDVPNILRYVGALEAHIIENGERYVLTETGQHAFSTEAGLRTMFPIQTIIDVATECIGHVGLADTLCVPMICGPLTPRGMMNGTPMYDADLAFVHKSSLLDAETVRPDRIAKVPVILAEEMDVVSDTSLGDAVFQTYYIIAGDIIIASYDAQKMTISCAHNIALERAAARGVTHIRFIIAWNIRDGDVTVTPYICASMQPIIATNPSAITILPGASAIPKSTAEDSLKVDSEPSDAAAARPLAPVPASPSVSDANTPRECASDANTPRECASDGNTPRASASSESTVAPLTPTPPNPPARVIPKQARVIPKQARAQAKSAPRANPKGWELGSQTLAQRHDPHGAGIIAAASSSRSSRGAPRVYQSRSRSSGRGHWRYSQEEAAMICPSFWDTIIICRDPRAVLENFGKHEGKTAASFPWPKFESRPAPPRSKTRAAEE